jgi:hypothetical protein
MVSLLLVVQNSDSRQVSRFSGQENRTWNGATVVASFFVTSHGAALFCCDEEPLSA